MQVVFIAIGTPLLSYFPNYPAGKITGVETGFNGVNILLIYQSDTQAENQHCLDIEAIYILYNINVFLTGAN